MAVSSFTKEVNRLTIHGIRCRHVFLGTLASFLSFSLIFTKKTVLKKKDRKLSSASSKKTNQVLRFKKINRIHLDIY